MRSRTTLLQWLDVPNFYARSAAPRSRRHHRRRLAEPGRTPVRQPHRQGLRARQRAHRRRLLRNADPSQVVYSLMLFERTPAGNLLRVNADNLERPFDINGGVKLDLGSTAKLRKVRPIYLEIVALLYRELHAQDAAALTARAA